MCQKHYRRLMSLIAIVLAVLSLAVTASAQDETVIIGARPPQLRSVTTRCGPPAPPISTCFPSSCPA